MKKKTAETKRTPIRPSTKKRPVVADRLRDLAAGLREEDRETAFCVIAWSTEWIARSRDDTDAEMIRIVTDIEAAKEAHKWKSVARLEAARGQREIEIWADVLREYGEVDMADSLLTDSDAFWKRIKKLLRPDGLER
jgi:hypothetical protein